MAPRKTMAALVVALAALIALAVTTAGSAKSTQNIRVAVVTDVGGLNDKGFNALANQGLQNAKKQLGVEGRVEGAIVFLADLVRVSDHPAPLLGPVQAVVVHDQRAVHAHRAAVVRDERKLIDAVRGHAHQTAQPQRVLLRQRRRGQFHGRRFSATMSIQPQRRGRPVEAPYSWPRSRMPCPTSSSSSVGNGPPPTRVA